jgi:hypothetical protein
MPQPPVQLSSTLISNALWWDYTWQFVGADRVALGYVKGSKTVIEVKATGTDGHDGLMEVCFLQSPPSLLR